MEYAIVDKDGNILEVILDDAPGAPDEGVYLIKVLSHLSGKICRGGTYLYNHSVATFDTYIVF